MESATEEDSQVSPKNEKCNGEAVVRVKEENKEVEDEEEEYIEVILHNFLCKLL